MTDKEIVKRAKDAEKRTNFGELVHSPISKGVNSAYGIGFIEGMIEYCNYLQEEPVSEDNNLCKASEEYLKVLSETPYNNTLITNAQTIVRELITFLDIPSKYNPNHIEEPVRENLPHIRHRDTLDEFAYQCAYDLSNDWAKETPEWKDVKTACKLGAQWQKEKIMSKTIDGEVGYWNLHGLSVNVELPLSVEEGDRVKVIVIEKEQYD